jgi:ABC-type phosphate transport system permease subunit
VAVKAIFAPRRDAMQQGALPWVLAACVAIMTASTIIIGGWLAINGLGGLLSALSPWSDTSVLRPLAATIYVTILALPFASVIGGLAAAALADERIFGLSGPAIRRWIALLGSIPTIVTATTIVIFAGAIGWHPTLSGASFAVAVTSIPLMTALASSVIGTSASPVGEAAIALGASPAFVVLRVLLPRAGWRFAGAFMLGATNIIGGAAVIAITAGALVPGSEGTAPIGAWPLAVQLWLQAPVASSYHATAAGALLLTCLLWLLQGIGLLRSTPASTGGATTDTEAR